MLIIWGNITKLGQKWKFGANIVQLGTNDCCARLFGLGYNQHFVFGMGWFDNISTNWTQSVIWYQWSHNSSDQW